MTWKQLKQHIENMTEQQQNDDVTVHVQSMDEYFGDISIQVTGYEELLDPDSFYLDVPG